MFSGVPIKFNTNFTFVVLIVTASTIERVERRCTGVVVGEDKVLTAAHCFLKKRTEVFSKDQVKVYAFVQDRFFSNQVYGIYIHPYYWDEREHDIAVVQTSRPIKSKIIQITKTLDPGGQMCSVLGYGLRYPSSLRAPMNLAILNMEFLKRDECELVTSRLENNVHCLPIQRGVGPCEGDSGGPAICNDSLIGILSRGILVGHDCGRVQFGMLYYEDVYTYKDWLNKVLHIPGSGTLPIKNVIHFIFYAVIALVLSTA